MPEDSEAVNQVAVNAKDIISKQTLGGAFGRLATGACQFVKSPAAQVGANLVGALSKGALIEDGSFDDDIETATLRWVIDLLCVLSPAAAKFQSTVGGAKVPTLTATVALGATLVSSADSLLALPQGPPPGSALSADDLCEA
jgi:hypothetical protein